MGTQVVQADETFRLVESTRHGRLYLVEVDANNKQYFLELWGRPYDMGRAHGWLLADQIVEPASMIATTGDPAGPNTECPADEFSGPVSGTLQLQVDTPLRVSGTSTRATLTVGPGITPEEYAVWVRNPDGQRSDDLKVVVLASAPRFRAQPIGPSEPRFV